MPTNTDKISKEYLVSQTIDLMNQELTQISDPIAVKKIIRTYFNRSNPDLYPMFDALFNSIILALCDNMQNQGIKQPSAADFLKAFRTIQGINVNIGNLHIENFTPTDQFAEIVAAEAAEIIKRTYELKPRPVEEVEAEEDLDATFDKYENFNEKEEEEESDEHGDDEDDIDEGENEPAGEPESEDDEEISGD